jgi:hypothetical protein
LGWLLLRGVLTTKRRDPSLYLLLESQIASRIFFGRIRLTLLGHR